MAMSTTLTAAAPGDALTFDNAALKAAGIDANIQTHNHTVVVADAVTSYDVDLRFGTKWIRAENGTDVLATDAYVIDQIGFDAVKITATAAGAVTLYHWKTA